jgi:hypothetical protein
MGWIVTKYLISAAIVVAVSEIATRSGKLGALVVALPLVSLLSLLWLNVEKQSAERMATFATYTFWYVLPTLPMFPVFSALVVRIGFWKALSVSTLLTAVLVYLLSLVLKRYAIELL